MKINLLIRYRDADKVFIVAVPSRARVWGRADFLRNLVGHNRVGRGSYFVFAPSLIWNGELYENVIPRRVGL